MIYLRKLKKIKDLQLADAVALGFEDAKPLEKAIETVKKFVIMLDQKYIRKKTQCILLGNLRDRYKEVCNIKVTNNAVCCVGVFTGHNKKQCFILSLLKISIKT